MLVYREFRSCKEKSLPTLILTDVQENCYYQIDSVRYDFDFEPIEISTEFFKGELCQQTQDLPVDLKDLYIEVSEKISKSNLGPYGPKSIP